MIQIALNHNSTNINNRLEPYSFACLRRKCSPAKPDISSSIEAGSGTSVPWIRADPDALKDSSPSPSRNSPCPLALTMLFSARLKSRVLPFR